MKKIALWAGLFIVPSLAHGAATVSTINTTNSYAWGANAGWVNWRPDPDTTDTTGVILGEFICSGWIYSGNVGWINVGNGSPVNHIQYQNNSAADFGLNYSVDSIQPGYGTLRGFAYAANIGWLNFEVTGNPRVRFTDGALEGYAWSANCGWINLGDPNEHNLKTDHIAAGVDSDGDGMPDAYEYLHFGNLSHDGTTDADGDGISDLQEYLDGTDPTQPNSALRITAYTANAGGTNSNITWTSTTARLYVIETKPDLLQANWDPDPTFGLAFAPDQGSSSTRAVTASSASRRFYRVRSIRPLP